jgi:uncharacterized membrane protein YeiH
MNVAFTLGFDRALLDALALAGLVVFAASGALVAARRRMDPFGFALLAAATGVGGGAARDALLSIPVSWIRNPTPLALCMGTGIAVFLAGRAFPAFVPWLERRSALVWADAIGLAIFAAAGAERALVHGAHWLTAITLGAATASFGGLMRDILAGERPLILHREIYVTAAVVGAAVYVGSLALGLPPDVATLAAVAAGFTLRALAIWRDWSLPTYAPPDDGAGAA